MIYATENPLKICILFGISIGDRYSLRISLLLVLIGIAGLYFEIINAFDYIQGARRVVLRLSFLLRTISTAKTLSRLTLIASDQGISTALFILSISRMLLIYLNYRFWIRMWKDTYSQFLNTGIFEREMVHELLKNINKRSSE